MLYGARWLLQHGPLFLTSGHTHWCAELGHYQTSISSIVVTMWWRSAGTSAVFATDNFSCPGHAYLGPVSAFEVTNRSDLNYQPQKFERLMACVDINLLWQCQSKLKCAKCTVTYMFNVHFTMCDCQLCSIKQTPCTKPFECHFDQLESGALLLLPKDAKCEFAQDSCKEHRVHQKIAATAYCPEIVRNAKASQQKMIFSRQYGHCNWSSEENIMLIMLSKLINIGAKRTCMCKAWVFEQTFKQAANPLKHKAYLRKYCSICLTGWRRHME